MLLLTNRKTRSRLNVSTNTLSPADAAVGRKRLLRKTDTKSATVIRQRSEDKDEDNRRVQH